jgi:ribosome maturation factor RimP
MNSLHAALTAHFNREVAVWLNHHDLKVLTGRLTEISADHFTIKTGADQTYLIPYGTVAAIRPQ